MARRTTILNTAVPPVDMLMTEPKKNKKQVEISVKSTTPIKFKDKPNRSAVRLNLLDTFGFVPEDIIIHKISGQSSKMVVSAVLTPEEIEKKSKADAKLKAKPSRKKGKGVAESKKAAKKGV